MKPLRVIDRNFNLITEVTDYEYISFTRRYTRYGEFEIRINANKISSTYLQKGLIVYMQHDKKKNGIIIHREISLNDNGAGSEDWIIKGISLKGLLRDRITIPPTGQSHDTVTGNAETVIKHYVNNNVVNPANANRKINMFTIAPNQNRGSNLSYGSRLRNLSDELETISLASGIGSYVYLDLSAKKAVFDVVEGKDRTTNQTENPPVIFSIEFGTVKSQKFIETESNYKNVAVVGGQGEGELRDIVIIGDGTSDLDRKEVFIDARDIEEGADLTERGNQKLAEFEKEVSFESEILNNGAMVFGKDYDLGDLVTVQNKKWGVVMHTRVTEVKESYSADGEEVEAVFGDDLPTLIDVIKRDIKNKSADVTR